MGEYVSREEHVEFAKRIEEGSKRADARLRELEKRDEQINRLTSDLQSLTQTVSRMLNIQERFNERLSKLEDRDGEKWRGVSGYVVTTITGAIIAYVLMRMGVM